MDKATCNTPRSQGAQSNLKLAPKQRPRVISVTSGKGGVGKTVTTVNLAMAARRMGLSVMILDGDFGLANVDVVLGLQARYNIRDVLDGNASLEEVIVEGPMGIKVIPSGSGITRLTNLTSIQNTLLEDQINQMNVGADVLFIDTGAGIADNVLNLNSICDDLIIVTTSEPHAMTDAYALIKVMAEEKGRKNAKLLVNQTKSPQEGLKVFQRISGVAKRFLNVPVEYLGHVPSDPQVAKNVLKRQAASEQSTFTIAGQAWNQVAGEIFSGKLNRHNGEVDADRLWQQILWSRMDQAGADCRV